MVQYNATCHKSMVELNESENIGELEYQSRKNIFVDENQCCAIV